MRVAEGHARMNWRTFINLVLGFLVGQWIWEHIVR